MCRSVSGEGYIPVGSANYPPSSVAYGATFPLKGEGLQYPLQIPKALQFLKKCFGTLKECYKLLDVNILGYRYIRN